jgi:hypothetical protein
VSPGGHLITTAVACTAVYDGTGSAALTAGLFAGGVLIDVDHAFDYVVFDRQRDLRPGVFLRYYLEGRVRRAVLFLHSYELLPLVAAGAWLTNWLWLWGLLLGMALHLPLDIHFNGRFQPGGMVRFYSFCYRWRAGFRADRLCDRSRLAPLSRDGFWLVFFRGSRPLPRPTAEVIPFPDHPERHRARRLHRLPRRLRRLG